MRTHPLIFLVITFLIAFFFGCEYRDTSVHEDYIDVKGGKVWYRIVGEGDAVLLFLLHGGPGFPGDYLKPLEALADERPVISYDQLGCGKSDRPEDTTLWRIGCFVEELAQVRKALGLQKYIYSAIRGEPFLQRNTHLLNRMVLRVLS